MTDIYTRRLTPWFLFVEAFRTFRARWKRVLGIGLPVSAVAIVTAQLLDDLFDQKEYATSGAVASAVVLASLSVSAANGFGTTFLSGVLDRTVGEHQHGHPAERLGTLLLRIPYGWLILADLLALVLKVLGFVLLIIPGFIAMTLLCVVGPVVMIERRRPWSAVKRSAQLVRPFFWLTFVSVTIPLLFENWLTDTLGSIDALHGLPAHFAVGLGIEAPIAIFVSLVEVTLAYHLMERNTPGQISAHAQSDPPPSAET
jgi:hypothetical protein